MNKEEFYKLWKDSTKMQILNQFYYDYEEMVKFYNIIKEVREYCENNKEFTDRLNDILEILYKADSCEVI